MISFYSVFPELAQKEARCIHILAIPGSQQEGPLPDEYAFVEHYCDDLNCDCRRVFLQVIAKNQPGKIFASIGYGWEKEEFYRAKMTWNPDDARGTVRGELDPLNEQSEFAEMFLAMFQDTVLDEVYRLRLRQHYLLLREEVARKRAEE